MSEKTLITGGHVINIEYCCITCGDRFSSGMVEYLCPKCGATGGHGFQKGNLIVESAIKPRLQTKSHIDPSGFLPLPVPAAESFKVGNTPLVAPARLKDRLGFTNLFLKNDSANPSGSLKDRASLLVAAQALHYKEKRVVLASTGNAGSSMSFVGAVCGLEIVLFVPANAPKAKIVQSMLYGAKVIPVMGTYDDAYKLSMEYSKKHGGINRNTAYNPLTVEGKKTVALELYNQLGYMVPDVIYVPTGDGAIYAGLCKGFIDLQKAGLINRLPQCVVVQAAGSNAIVKSWTDGTVHTLDNTTTVADSLSVLSPANGEMVLHYLKQTKGWCVEVSDPEILDAQRTLASQAGVFVEPSSSAAWAALEKDVHQGPGTGIHPESLIVILLTGTGFKDMRVASQSVSIPPACPVDIRTVDDYINRYF